MSDYSRVNDFSVKDALPTGDANKKIKGSEVDAEFDSIVISNNTKADKVTSPTDGAYLVQDSNGNLADGGVVISSYADTLLDDADADAARLTLAVDSAANGSTIIQTGTTAQRDGSPAAGYLRANTDLTRLEWYNGSDWVDAGGLAGLITTRGDLIRGDSGGAAERYAIGSSGQFLMSDGSDAVWQTRGPVASSVQATTSGTAFDFTSIPSWVSKITVMLNGVSLNGGDDLLIQIGDSGGVEASGYLSSSGNDGNGTNDGSSTAGYFVFVGASGDAMSGILTIVNVTGNVWVARGGFHRGSGDVSTSSSGTKTLSGTLDRVRLTRDGSNTFDAGQVNIIYE